MTSTRDRLVLAAFALFEQQGYDETTVDAIAAEAGTGRTTFFRHFRSKEHVVFPDHDSLLPQVDARLATATPATYAAALSEASRIVFDHYLAEGETARARYRLTSTVPALRDRELASAHRYLRTFIRHTQEWYAGAADGEPGGALRAELVAGAVVTAHNHVLRRWLRDELDDLDAAFDDAMAVAVSLSLPTGGNQDSAVVVIRGGNVDDVVAEIRRTLGS